MTDEDPALTEPLSALMERALSNPLPISDKRRPSAHTKLVKQTMDALQKLPGRKRIRKRQVGRFIVTDPAGNPRKQTGRWVYVKVSVAGDPDIELAYLPPGQRHVIMYGLECKTGTGRLTDEQIKKRDGLLELGWEFLVVRDAAQAFQDVLAAAKQTR